MSACSWGDGLKELATLFPEGGNGAVGDLAPQRLARGKERFEGMEGGRIGCTSRKLAPCALRASLTPATVWPCR